MVNSLIKTTTIIIICIYLNVFYKTRNIIVILSMTSHGTGVWTVSSNLPSCRLPWVRGVQREPLSSQVPKGSLHNSTCQLNADLPLLGFFVKLKEIHSIRNTAGNLEVRMERGTDGECVSKAMAKSSDPTPPPPNSTILFRSLFAIINKADMSTCWGSRHFSFSHALITCCCIWHQATTVQLYPGRDTFEFDQGHVTKNQPVTMLVMLSEILGI